MGRHNTKKIGKFRSRKETDAIGRKEEIWNKCENNTQEADGPGRIFDDAIAKKCACTK